MKSIIYITFTGILFAYAAEVATTFGNLNQNDEQGNTTNSIRLTHGGFDWHETKIQNFIKDLQQTYTKMDSGNGRFIDELRKRAEKLELPKNKTRSFTVKYRSRCFCEGKFWSPCPDRCMDSCYYHEGAYPYNWIIAKNCSGLLDNLQCYCYEGSSTRCDSGPLDKCIQYKTVEKFIDQPCIEFTPDWDILATSYLRLSELITEPIKKIIRDLELRSAHLKQVAETSDILNDLTSQQCDEQKKSPCLPEAKSLKSEQLVRFSKLQLNMTLEMVSAQKDVQRVSEGVNSLQDRTLAQLHRSIKDYTCCMKGSNVNVPDEDCNSTPAVSELTTAATTHVQSTRQSPTPRGDFRCSNKKWIPDSYVCDGEDDCGDDFDESDC